MGRWIVDPQWNYVITPDKEDNKHKFALVWRLIDHLIQNGDLYPLNKGKTSLLNYLEKLLSKIRAEIRQRPCDDHSEMMAHMDELWEYESAFQHLKMDYECELSRTHH
jgi:hypothetical protein